MRFDPIRCKMQEAGLDAAAIRSFEHAYGLLASKETGLIPESSICPVESLPLMESVCGDDRANDALVSKTVVLKLNGGLGTGMGLDRAKSLLPVREGLNFLDLTARQFTASDKPPRFVLLNSFSTSADTLAHLSRYPALGDPLSLELMQNKVPKLHADTLSPVEWSADPAMEWCPPGHGDLYPALYGSGMLRRLLDEGYLYLFVSNSDNLGATLHPGILQWFAASDKSFVMEVTPRTVADRKGGHLAIRRADRRLLLRESAQCPEEDSEAFQEIERHRFFNTNNLWLRLDRLDAALKENGGLIPLPMIANRKTVDPRDSGSTAVIQLESAMGAAIECFPDAVALQVPRSRFSPVKTTADLLALRSDAYEITDDGRVTLAAERNGVPPEITLDSSHYKICSQLDSAFPDGAPSLLHCRSLRIQGPVRFASNVIFCGDVEICNPSAHPVTLPAGEYTDIALTLPLAES